MGSKILSKLSIVIMKKRTRCEKIVEARRQCKKRFSMNSLFASNFISFILNLHKDVLAPQKGSCHFIVL